MSAIQSRPDSSQPLPNRMPASQRRAPKILPIIDPKTGAPISIEVVARVVEKQSNLLPKDDHVPKASPTVLATNPPAPSQAVRDALEDPSASKSSDSSDESDGEVFMGRSYDRNFMLEWKNSPVAQILPQDFQTWIVERSRRKGDKGPIGPRSSKK